MPIIFTPQLFQFLLIGGVSAGSYVVICTFLVQWGLRPGIVSLMGYLLVIVPAYLGQKRITFGSKARHREDFPRYLALQAFGIIASYVLSEWLSATHVGPWEAYTFLAVSIAGLNFLMMKYWTFRAPQA